MLKITRWRHSGEHPSLLIDTWAQSLSRIRLFVTLWTVAHQAPLSMGFSSQGYWSELSFPSLGDLPDPRIEPTSLMSPALAGSFFTTEPLGKPLLSEVPVKTVCKLKLHFLFLSLYSKSVFVQVYLYPGLHLDCMTGICSSVTKFGSHKA